MEQFITFMEGDGIGKEIMPQTLRVVDAAMAKAGRPKVVWEPAYMGEDAHTYYGDHLPKETLDSIKRNKVGIKGPTNTPLGKGHKSANVRLRTELNLNQGIRIIKTLPGLPLYQGKKVDLVIFRENTEGLYIGEEYPIEDGVESIRRVTKKATWRICSAAFDYAARKHRKSVTVFHKANILKESDGLFLQVAQEVARRYVPTIEFNNLIIDNAAMQLVLDPSWLDVLVMENLFGDIISDMCAGFVRGLGLVPGANIGDDYAVFEAAHGTAPNIAGQNKANPTALILSAVMMLEYIDEPHAARILRNAIMDTYREGIYLTGDVKPVDPVGTIEMTDAIIKKIQQSE